MLTQMTDTDWGNAVSEFRAVRSKRGKPGHDDRKFLEALHYFQQTQYHVERSADRVWQLEQQGLRRQGQPRCGSPRGICPVIPSRRCQEPAEILRQGS